MKACVESPKRAKTVVDGRPDGGAASVQRIVRDTGNVTAPRNALLFDSVTVCAQVGQTMPMDTLRVLIALALPSIDTPTGPDGGATQSVPADAPPAMSAAP